jgi:peptide/nickel transport system permease protein
MRALVRRVVQLVVVVLVVTFFSAALLEFLSGDPVQTMAPFSTEQQRDKIRHQLNLDDPLPQRYVAWLGDFVTGDLGNYYRGPQVIDPVSDDAWDGFGVSLQLMLYAQLLTLLLAVPIGVLTAYRARSWLDRGINALNFGLISIPNFVFAYILVFWIAIKLGWLPGSGYHPLRPPPGETFFNSAKEHFRHMALPALSLALGQIAVYARLLRSDMVATLQEDFILMAKSKGISSSRILWRHALRPSSLTLLTVAGLNVGALIGGAVVIERIFGLPGTGTQIINAIGARQYVALQSLSAILAITYVLVNFFVDFLYTVLDPRIRNARTAV